MARVQDVDPNMVARTRNWLLAQRRPDGSWDADDNPMLHDDLAGGRSAEDARLAETAYIAWAVFGDPGASGQAVATFNYLKGHAPETIRDAHTLALVCNALLAADEHDADAAPYLDRLESMKHFDAAGKFAWWEQPAGARTTFYGAGRSGEVETTALATLALVRAGRNPDTTRRPLAWLTSQKDPKGTWHSTQATVLALKALLAGTGKPLGGDAERVVELRLDGELIDTVRIPADQADVLKQVDLSARLKPGKQVLTVSEGARLGDRLPGVVPLQRAGGRPGRAAGSAGRRSELRPHGAGRERSGPGDGQGAECDGSADADGDGGIAGPAGVRAIGRRLRGAGEAGRQGGQVPDGAAAPCCCI